VDAAFRTSVAAAALLATAIVGGTLVRAQDAAPVPLVERTRGADRVVVGRVTGITPEWRTNEYGDRLIVSVAHVAVAETLKGQAQPSVDVEVEGGTLDGVTLHVSDVAPIAVGDRAVFYLRRNTRGALVPHLRGQGLIKLDRAGRVPGTSLTLDTIRREAAAAAALPGPAQRPGPGQPAVPGP
jgi:hypothetical protein